MNRRTDLPEELPEAFRVGHAIHLQVPKGRMRGNDLVRPYWGTRTRSRPQTTTERLLAYSPRMPARAFACGVTAAALHGIALPSRLAGDELHIGVRRGDRRVDAAGLRAHHLTIPESEIVAVDGIRATSLERTWCDLATSKLTRRELVAAADSALWWKSPRTSQERLAAAVARYDGRGRLMLRDVLPLLSDRADSPPESELRVAIIDAGLQTPCVNRPIYDSFGRFVAQPDLTWPELMVALEYEGDHHRTDRMQWHSDIARFGRLQELGWITIRATAADYRDPGRLVAQLMRILTARAADGTNFAR